MLEETKVERSEAAVGCEEFKPATSDMIATIDADTVAYATASVCEAGDDEAGYTLDLDYALEEAMSRIEEIKSITGCKDAELHFTGGKNFRFTLTGTYKANRKGSRTPAGLHELKCELLKHYEGRMHTDVEADDYVAYQKKFWPDKYIVCSPDKDVYNGVEGVNFNYFKRAKGKFIKKDIPMTWVKTTSNEALYWVYMQVLMGDSTDGIQGIPRCGPAKALDILCPSLQESIKKYKAAYKEQNKKAIDGNKVWPLIVKKYSLTDTLDSSETKLWGKVIDAYENSGLTEKDATLNMRLVSMNQIDKEGKLCLWTTPIQ